MINKTDSDVKINNFFVLAGLDLLEQRYRIVEEVSGGKSSTAFYGVDEQTGRQVFIKMAICPRSELEKARFRNEARFLKARAGQNGIIKKTAEYLAHGEIFDGRVLYLVTEKINGVLLSEWIENHWAASSLSDRLLIAYRVFGASEYYGISTTHRDLHPGNIMLLDEVVDMRSRVPDYKAIILDWGQSCTTSDYYEEPDADMVTIRNGIGREITNSFYNLPPETFKDWDEWGEHVPKYDSWAMGLLLYRLVTGEDMFSFTNIGQFAQAMRRIESNVDSRLWQLQHHAGGKSSILRGLIGRLLKVDQRARMSIQTARQALWLIIEEDF
ncbi:protein kinase domain-containing protein [Pseudomonas juntendi]